MSTGPVGAWEYELEHHLEARRQDIEVNTDLRRAQGSCRARVLFVEVAVNVVQLPQHVGVPVPIDAERHVGLLTAVDHVRLRRRSPVGFKLVGQIGVAETRRHFEGAHAAADRAEWLDRIDAAVAAAVNGVGVAAAEGVGRLHVCAFEFRVGLAATVDHVFESFALIEKAAECRRCFHAVNLHAGDRVCRRAESARGQELGSFGAAKRPEFR